MHSLTPFMGFSAKNSVCRFKLPADDLFVAILNLSRICHKPKWIAYLQCRCRSVELMPLIGRRLWIRSWQLLKTEINIRKMCRLRANNAKTRLEFRVIDWCKWLCISLKGSLPCIYLLTWRLCTKKNQGSFPIIRRKKHKRGRLITTLNGNL